MRTKATLAAGGVPPATRASNPYPSEVRGPTRSGSGARWKKQESRGRLIVALSISIAVPTAVIVGLWRNLAVPFWFNEQWRAYFISYSGNWWGALKTDGAPFPAGWFLIERSASVLFGSTELTLRLPTVLFLPLTSALLTLLARRWIPLSASLAVGLIGSLTGTLLVFAVQLSEYQVDAAAAIAVLLLHEVAWETPGRRRIAVILTYGGIALACIVGTPALFIAAPTLLLDVKRGWHDRTRRMHLGSSIAAGTIILIHLGLFVVRQNALTKSTYWDGQFLPHHGLTKQFAFVWHGLKGFVFSTFTSSYSPFLPSFLSPKHSWILTALFLIFLANGLLVLSGSPRGRTVVAAVGGSLLLTLVASYLRYWPFGFVRTNFYLVPVLIFVAGVGAVHLIALPDLRHILKQKGSWVPSKTWPLRAVRIAAALLVLVATSLAVAFELNSYQQIRASAHSLGYGAQIGQVVATVRSQATGDEVVVVEGAMAVNGWGYYQFEYSGRSVRTGPELSRSRVLMTVDPGAPSITDAVAHLRPSQVFLYIPLGTTQADISSDLAAISREGACVGTRQYEYSVSGVLLELRCARRTAGG